jgi:hypothetical protein
MLKHNETFNQYPPAGFDGLVMWDYLKPAWHREGAMKQIEPMDIDCLVERKKWFLAFETKAPGKKMDQGQEITLANLLKVMPAKRLHLVECAKRPEDIDGWWVSFRSTNGKIVRKRYEGDASAFLAWCRRWFEWADADGQYVPRT